MEDSRHSGFSLIELLVVIAVVALLAGVALPALGRHFDNARLRAASTALLHELGEARNHALQYQRSVHFSFSGTSATDWCYTWSVAAPCDCKAQSGCNTTATGRRRTRAAATDFPSVRLWTRRSPQRHTLRFSAIRGNASADTIRLENPGGSVDVVVSPLGRVRACARRGSLYPRCAP